jgi:hypothetical protein
VAKWATPAKWVLVMCATDATWATDAPWAPWAKWAAEADAGVDALGGAASVVTWANGVGRCERSVGLERRSDA